MKNNTGLYLAGAAAIAALGFAFVANAKETQTKPKRRGDGTRTDMPANDTTKEDFDPVVLDPSLGITWSEETKKKPGTRPPPPSLQPVDPPNAGAPDGTYDTTVFAAPSDIRAFFAAFGYIPESNVDDTPMNGLGPDRKLGGGDDEPNADVLDFQEDYNLVSKVNEQTLIWGTLDEDGLVGPHTLNALLHAKNQAVDVAQEDLADWWGALVAAAVEPEPQTPADNGDLPGITGPIEG